MSSMMIDAFMNEIDGGVGQQLRTGLREVSLKLASHGVCGLELTVCEGCNARYSVLTNVHRCPVGKMTNNRQKIEELTKDFRLSNSSLQKICDKLLTAMEKGLSKEGHKDAAVKMFPTYVRHLPTGDETGKFLALDLGGTHFRVILIQLDGSNKSHMESKIFAIPKQIMVGTGDALFDHIADCLAQFTKEFKVDGDHIPLGFTFSFPCKQQGLKKATLVKWTKGFTCSGVEGQDVVHLLKQAINRRKDIKVDIVALVNDTTGTLMSCAYKNKNCRIGLIVGTGTNACYVERLENVGTWDEDTEDPKQVIINTEWGAFGSDGALDFIRTPQDRELDNNSNNPGFQVFEKMISGMYMGELVRLILRDAAKLGLLFNGQSSESLEEAGSFYTKYISEIEGDNENELESTIMVLEELGLSHATVEDCQNVRYICKLISERAANLAAAGTAVLVSKVNQPNVTIGVDGSVNKLHPHFHDLMTAKIAELIDPKLKFSLTFSEDGSGRGAALVAAVAVQVK